MFSSDLIIKQLPEYKWSIQRSFTFTSKDGFKIKIPKGFVTDLASVPRPLWWFISPAGKHAQACVVHDYMYDNAIETKKKADLMFYEGLQELGVPKVRAWLMYMGVKLFGKGSYV